MFAGRIKHSKFSNELFVLFFQIINVLLELCYLPLWVMRQLGLLRGKKELSRDRMILATIDTDYMLVVFSLTRK